MDNIEKEGEAINLRYRKILRSMVFGNFTATVQNSVDDAGNPREDPEILPFCG